MAAGYGYHNYDYGIHQKRPEKRSWICDICGKLIETEEHVKITTKRRTKLHIHNECIRVGAMASPSNCGK